MIQILQIKVYWKITLLGITFTAILEFIEKYFFNDWDFLKWICVLIAIDTTTGVYKAYKLKCISSKGWGQVINKLIVYGMFLIVIHALQNFTVGKEVSGWFGWIDNAAFGTLMVREAVSIFENLAVISPTVFPKSWIDRLKDIEIRRVNEAIDTSFIKKEVVAETEKTEVQNETKTEN